jgi:hypothetical protein
MQKIAITTNVISEKPVVKAGYQEKCELCKSFPELCNNCPKKEAHLYTTSFTRDKQFLIAVGFG